MSTQIRVPTKYNVYIRIKIMSDLKHPIIVSKLQII